MTKVSVTDTIIQILDSHFRGMFPISSGEKLCISVTFILSSTSIRRTISDTFAAIPSVSASASSADRSAALRDPVADGRCETSRPIIFRLLSSLVLFII